MKYMFYNPVEKCYLTWYLNKYLIANKVKNFATKFDLTEAESILPGLIGKWEILPVE